MIQNPWLTLNPSMAMHFLIRITRGAQRYLSLVERGKSHLDRLCLSMPLDRPESHLYDYPVTVQRLIAPK